MTDELANSLGLRALALGMPWVDGLMDGLWILRVGCYDHPNYQKNDPHRQCGDSWPDFRDPLTETWLVAWGHQLAVLKKLDALESYSERLVLSDGSRFEPKGYEFGVLIDEPEHCIYETADTRAEAWINALEQLRGEE